MAQSNILESLWLLPPGGSLCCECGGRITPGEALARTFTIERVRATHCTSPSRTIEVPSLSEVLLIFERHFRCLLENKVEYITISHVWHEVAKLQLAKTEHAPRVHQTEAFFLERPVAILRGLAEHIPDGMEIWHDYISVPQRVPQVKNAIIAQLPQLYFHARWTAAILEDVNASDFQSMRDGETWQERCKAISRLCVAKWFSRLWTVMEMTQSEFIRVMVPDVEVGTFTLIKHDTAYSSFVEELRTRWNNEVRTMGSVWPLEKLAEKQFQQPQRALWPWQLGPIEMVQDQNKGHAPTPFAMAYDLLAKREVTILEDFFHAMTAVLKPTSAPRYNGDPGNMMLQLIGCCLERGDFSPIIMSPIAKLHKDGPVYEGYIDPRSFSLGGNAMLSPSYTLVTFDDSKSRLCIKAERLGKVQSVHTTRKSRDERLITHAQLALSVTGLDFDEFVNTVGVRFYGQNGNKIKNRLLEEGRKEQCIKHMTTLATADDHDSTDRAARSLADLMGLSNKSLDETAEMHPMEFCEQHGATIHQTGYKGTHTTIGVPCPVCKNTFLIRVAKYFEHRDIYGAEVIRIPGLKYPRTHEGGTGVLLQDGEIVGRFLWGAPTCECDKVADVNIVLDVSGLPLPKGARG